MFGLISGLVDTVVGETEKIIDNPVKYAVDTATRPLKDTVEILEGLTEGELRTKAIARLGADAVVGLGSAELIDLMVD